MLEKIIRLKLSTKFIAILLIAAFIAAIIPIFVIAFYNRPAADDYSYGILTVHAWKETGSIVKTIGAAFQQVADSYESWQGTYSAIFLFSLQPGIFSEQIYFLSTYIMLAALITSTCYLLRVLLIHYLKAERWVWIIVSLTILLLSIQLIPFAEEAFYWYNGSMYYTFFYSMLLFQTGLCLKLPLTAGKKCLVFRSIMIVLLSIMIGGGNYCTALLACLVQILMGIYYTYRKDSGRFIIYGAFIVLLICFCISGLAPGNSVRADQLQSMTPVKAIIFSLLYALSTIGSWTSLIVIAAMLLLIPLFWQCTKKVTCSFRYPLLVMIGTYCLYAAQMAPPFYAMSGPGAGRIINIYYYSYILLFAFNVFYLTGWIRKQVEMKIQDRFPVKADIKHYPVTYLLLLCFMVSAGALSFGVYNLTSISAAVSLVNGEAQSFADEMDARLLIYNDPDITEAVVSPLSRKPAVFPADSIQTDWDNWQNRDVSSYYDKTSIRLAE